MKQRKRRGEQRLDHGTVLVRANRLDPAGLRIDALRNCEVYGFYGISVFGSAAGQGWEAVASQKLGKARWVVLFSSSDLLAAGIDVWDTGMTPHYDLVHENLDQLLVRILGTPHRVLPNPGYRGGEP